MPFTYFELLRRQRGVRYSRDRVFCAYDVPSIGIMVRPPEEMCLEIGKAIADTIKGHIRSGRDAKGRTLSLKPRTLEARVEDAQRPKTTRSDKGMLRARMKKEGANFKGRLWGTIRRGKRQQRARWDRQYPEGKGPRGVTPFYASGFLHDSIKAEITDRDYGGATKSAAQSKSGLVSAILKGGGSGAGVFSRAGSVSISYDKRRRAAVVELERRGYSLIAIPGTGYEMGDALEQELETILSPIGGVEGLTRGVGVRLGLGAILRGVASGLGV